MPSRPGLPPQPSFPRRDCTASIASYPLADTRSLTDAFMCDLQTRLRTHRTAPWHSRSRMMVGGRPPQHCRAHHVDQAERRSRSRAVSQMSSTASGRPETMNEAFWCGRDLEAVWATAALFRGSRCYGLARGMWHKRSGHSLRTRPTPSSFSRKAPPQWCTSPISAAGGACLPAACDPTAAGAWLRMPY